MKQGKSQAEMLKSSEEFVLKWKTYSEAASTVDKLIDVTNMQKQLKENDIFQAKDLGLGTLDFSCARFKVMKIEHNGAVVTYQVLIGSFAVNLLVLNVDSRKLSGTRKVLYSKTGVTVFEVPALDGKSYVCKRLDYMRDENVLRFASDGIEWTIPGNYAEVQQVLHEIALGKICAVLGIGPKCGSPYHCFDLICYRNAMEFFFERCKPLLQYVDSDEQSEEEIRERLLYCMRVMHRHHLIHKDIKPDNVLYSVESHRLVLCDFGISTAVAQCENEKSSTFREGTLTYMSPEMKKIGRGNPGQVNLYENDLYSLQMTMRDVGNRINEGRTTRQYKTTIDSWNNSLDDEEQALLIASEMYRSKCLTADVANRLATNTTFQRLFGKYFSIQNPHSKQMNAPNVQFFLRSIGLRIRLEEELHLERIDDQKTKLLLAKLQRIYNSDSAPMGFIYTHFSVERLNKQVRTEIQRIESEEDKYTEDNRQVCSLLFRILPTYFKSERYSDVEELLQLIKMHVLEESKQEFKQWNNLLEIALHSDVMYKIDSILSEGTEVSNLKLFQKVCQFIKMQYHRPRQLANIISKVLPQRLNVNIEDDTQACFQLLKNLLNSIDANLKPRDWETIAEVAFLFLEYSNLFKELLELYNLYTGKVPVICELRLFEFVINARLIEGESISKEAINGLSRIVEITKKLFGNNDVRYLRVLSNYAQALMEIGDNAKAKELLMEINSKEILFGQDNSFMGEYYMGLAMCLLKTGETERAIEFASKATKNAKKFGLKRFISFKILYDKAHFDYMYSEQVNTLESILEAKRVLEIHLSNEDKFIERWAGYYCLFNYLLAKLNLKLSNEEEALRLLRKAADFNTTYKTTAPRAYSLQLLSEIYMSSGRKVEAAEALEKLNQLRQSQQGRNLFGVKCSSTRVWLKLGRADKVEQLLHETVRMLRGSPQQLFQNNLINSKDILNAALDAVDISNIALAYDLLESLRTSSEYCYYVGCIEMRAKNWKQATTSFEKYIELEATCQTEAVLADSYRCIGQAAQKLNELPKSKHAFGRAIEIYKVLIHKGTNLQDNYDFMGLCLMDIGKPSQALNILLRSLVLSHKGKASIYLPTLHVVECLVKLGAISRIFTFVRRIRDKKSLSEMSSSFLNFMCYGLLSHRKSKQLYKLLSSVLENHRQILCKAIPKLQAFLIKYKLGAQLPIINSLQTILKEETQNQPALNPPIVINDHNSIGDILRIRVASKQQERSLKRLPPTLSIKLRSKLHLFRKH